MFLWVVRTSSCERDPTECVSGHHQSHLHCTSSASLKFAEASADDLPRELQWSNHSNRSWQLNQFKLARKLACKLSRKLARNLSRKATCLSPKSLPHDSVSNFAMHLIWRSRTIFPMFIYIKEVPLAHPGLDRRRQQAVKPCGFDRPSLPVSTNNRSKHDAVRVKPHLYWYSAEGIPFNLWSEWSEQLFGCRERCADWWHAYTHRTRSLSRE